MTKHRPPATAGGLSSAGRRGLQQPEAVRQDYLDRIRDHPAASFTEPFTLTGALESVPKAFVSCTTSNYAEQIGGDPVAVAAAHAREAGGPTGRSTWDTTRRCSTPKASPGS